LLDGVNVAVVPLYVTVPVTPLFKVNVAVLTVDAVIASLNVAVIEVFTATAVALLTGLVDDTVGAVVSAVDDPPPPPPLPHPAKLKAASKTNAATLMDTF
jgi:hypothetical protein